MNTNLQNRLVEVVSTNNIAYKLNNSNEFSVTGYKVMTNQIGTGLLPCAKVKYNGDIKLVYMIGNYRPLSFVATRLGINEIHVIIFNLIQRALDIQSNGFFRAENIELDFDKIFVDMADYSVHLIYFPISTGNTGMMSNFDSEFRVNLIKLFNTFPVFAAPQFQRLCSDLSNGSMPLSQIMRKLKESIGPIGGIASEQMDSPKSQPESYIPVQPEIQPTPPSSTPSQPPMTIRSIGSPVQLTLTVTEPEYSIGKNPSMVNGAVTYNPAISRLHCKIHYINGKYYIEDLASANGTFLNQTKLDKLDKKELHNGDYIRLANSDFIISF